MNITEFSLFPATAIVAETSAITTTIVVELFKIRHFATTIVVIELIFECNRLRLS